MSSPPAVAADAAARVQHPVARDDDRDRVAAERVAGRACAARAAGCGGHLPVGRHLAERDPVRCARAPAARSRATAASRASGRTRAGGPRSSRRAAGARRRGAAATRPHAARRPRPAPAAPCRAPRARTRPAPGRGWSTPPPGCRSACRRRRRRRRPGPRPPRGWASRRAAAATSSPLDRACLERALDVQFRDESSDHLCVQRRAARSRSARSPSKTLRRAASSEHSSTVPISA